MKVFYQCIVFYFVFLFAIISCQVSAESLLLLSDNHDACKVINVMYKKKDAELSNKSIDLNMVLDLYNDIHDLPVSEMLNLLDELVDEFDFFSEQYELENHKLSWSSWLAGYWWSIPTMIGKVFLICFARARALGLIKIDRV